MKQRALLKEEFEQLLCVCKNVKERFLVTILGYQGFRINELLRMRKEYYLKFPAGDAIRVPAKEVEPGREYVKTDIRVVPVMHRRVQEVWVEWFKDHKTYEMPYITANKMIERISLRAGIGRITCHTLRHTAATWLAYKDYNATEIAEFMGHKGIGTAMRHYIHPTGGMMRRAIKNKGRFDE